MNDKIVIEVEDIIKSLDNIDKIVNTHIKNTGKWLSLKTNIGNVYMTLQYLLDNLK